MEKRVFILAITALMLALLSCKSNSDEFRSLKPEVLKDKIAGGWAGKMIGVTYGAPTEFRALRRTFEE